MYANNDPDKFYDEIVMAYKGKLEEWYVGNLSIILYFQLIFITIFEVLFNSRKTVWAIFKQLPDPPKAIAQWL